MPKFYATVGADFRAYLNFDIEAATQQEADDKAVAIVEAFAAKPSEWPDEFGTNTFGNVQWDSPENVDLIDVNAYQEGIS